MFNILIVEDNTDKLREIIQLLSTIENIDVDLIDSELDAISAKKRLKVKAYDFLILDIAIPNRKADQPDLEGGLKLLNEILNRKVYKIPTHIIGLTAKEEIILENGFKVNTVPTRHFSGRGLKRNRALWTSFVLQTPSRKMPCRNGI